jgi:hypothetical protein
MMSRTMRIKKGRVGEARELGVDEMGDVLFGAPEPKICTRRSISGAGLVREHAALSQHAKNIRNFNNLKFQLKSKLS